MTIKCLVDQSCIIFRNQYIIIDSITASMKFFLSQTKVLFHRGSNKLRQQHYFSIDLIGLESRMEVFDYLAEGRSSLATIEYAFQIREAVNCIWWLLLALQAINYKDNLSKCIKIITPPMMEAKSQVYFRGKSQGD